jgi:hypothetical protein
LAFDEGGAVLDTLTSRFALKGMHRLVTTSLSSDSLWKEKNGQTIFRPTWQHVKHDTVTL